MARQHIYKKKKTILKFLIVLQNDKLVVLIQSPLGKNHTKAKTTWFKWLTALQINLLYDIRSGESSNPY